MAKQTGGKNNRSVILLGGIYGNNEPWFNSKYATWRELIAASVRKFAYNVLDDWEVQQRLNELQEKAETKRQIQKRLQKYKAWARNRAAGFVGSWYSVLMYQRVVDSGVTHYIWRTQEDNRVRPGTQCLTNGSHLSTFFPVRSIIAVAGRNRIGKQKQGLTYECSKTTICQSKGALGRKRFLVDRPIMARIGLQVYQTPHGERREFRPASEVFKADSLATYAGKPITLGHVTVTPENADRVVVGSCAGAGVPNGVGVEAPLSIYVKRAIESAKKRDTAEISVGYTSIDIDKPGWGCNETGEYIFEEDMKADEQPPKGWVKFDALQTNISVNHIALVFKGRAGIAKLNLDSEQEFPYDNSVKSDDGDITMTVKIKLDGAVEFDVPKEVATFIDNLKADVTAANKKLMALKQSATTKKRLTVFRRRSKKLLKSESCGRTCGARCCCWSWSNRWTCERYDRIYQGNDWRQRKIRRLYSGFCSGSGYHRRKSRYHR
ncbi:portal protein [Salmonella virus STSR3]|nr:portal protein [Salmonella virus STSR3]